jgi:hypothetical protein
MITQNAVNDQLKKIGADFRLWGRNEIKELGMILAENEELRLCVNGYYINGFAMMVATDRRLILIDHKPMFLTLEVCWYDKIGQIDFNHRLLNATLCVSTPNKDIQFTSWNNSKLREILLYSQEKIAEAKHSEEDFNKRQIDPQIYSETPNKQGMINQVFEPRSNFNSVVQLPDQDQPQPSATVNHAINSSSKTYDLTLYGATRLPFSRRRYFSRQVGELEN